MNTPIFLNALKAFEATARHQSFSGAAKELNVTPAAVGQLVRGLENYLGIKLFYRQQSGKNRLAPTELAISALPDIKAGFDKLSLGLVKLEKGSLPNLLTIAVSPAFAAKWLLPRIDKFQNRYPEIDIRLDTNLKTINFVEYGVDVGIRYGRGSWPGLIAEKLMHENIFPVCSQAFYQSHKQTLENPLNLLKLPLIHDLSMDQHVDFTTWDKWLSFNKITHDKSKRGLKINNSAAVLQAAIEGQGIALARSVMAYDDLKSEGLIQLYPKLQCPSTLAYYFVYREECQSFAKLVAFKSWLMQEVEMCLKTLNLREKFNDLYTLPHLEQSR